MDGEDAENSKNVCGTKSLVARSAKHLLINVLGIWRSIAIKYHRARSAMPSLCILSLKPLSHHRHSRHPTLSKLCKLTSSKYFPLLLNSSPCVPLSTTLPPSNT